MQPTGPSKPRREMSASHKVGMLHDCFVFLHGKVSCLFSRANSPHTESSLSPFPPMSHPIPSLTQCRAGVVCAMLDDACVGERGRYSVFRSLRQGAPSHKVRVRRIHRIAARVSKNTVATRNHGRRLTRELMGRSLGLELYRIVAYVSRVSNTCRRVG